MCEIPSVAREPYCCEAVPDNEGIVVARDLDRKALPRICADERGSGVQQWMSLARCHPLLELKVIRNGGERVPSLCSG